VLHVVERNGLALAIGGGDITEARPGPVTRKSTSLKFVDPQDSLSKPSMANQHPEAMPPHEVVDFSLACSRLVRDDDI
jgi:hypothetical protein